MSLIQPTRQVVISGTDVSDDCLEIQAIDTSLDHALPHVQIKLSNIAGQYASTWPPFGETGLYYPGYVKFNDVEVLRFRFEGVDPELSKQNEILLDGIVVGGTCIQKQYMTQNYSGKADDVIADVVGFASSCKQWGDGITNVTYTSPSTAEVININPKKEYCHDIIRKILERENWTATLRATSDTVGALDIFPVADAAHRHSTIFQSGQVIKHGRVHAM